MIQALSGNDVPNTIFFIHSSEVTTPPINVKIVVIVKKKHCGKILTVT